MPDANFALPFDAPAARCVICDAKIAAIGAHAAKTCASLECQRRELELRLGSLRTRAAGETGVEAPESYVTAVVPDKKHRLRRNSRRRRTSFLRRLRDLVDESLSARDDPDADPLDPANFASPGANDAIEAWVGGVCQACGGACCYQGGEHAFLDRATILSFLEMHPDADRESVVKAYGDRLPERTQADSCVFHGPRGCALTREMRSATCNKFECPGLRTARRSLSWSDGPPHVFVLAQEGREHRPLAFVALDQVTRCKKA